tara:strand:- start:6283 stop:7539 length:1257 start_codon:yes stop_codon:yes gene_type:complete
MRRVVVTGMGMVTPLGCGVTHNWEMLTKGQSGADYIRNFDAKNFKCKIACEVPRELEQPGSFVAEEWIEKKEIKKVDDFIKFSLASSQECFENSKIIEISDDLSKRSGCIIGSGMGGLPGIEATSIDFHAGKRISPFFITGRIINMPAGYLSIKYNLRGPSYSTVSACASSAHAIGESFRLIQHGQADLMLTGGTEATISPIGIEGFVACKALSTKYNDKPKLASRPFDEDRDGFVMGEGSASLILEEMDHALRRNANILCEVTGYGMSSDAYHYTLPEPSGDGAFRAMENCISDGKKNVSDIQYINAHGTSTPAGDKAEIEAIERLFRDTEGVYVSSTKSQTGHLLGAAGGVEAIYSILSLKMNILPYNLNLENEVTSKKVKFIKDRPLKNNINNVISNSFGFGGTNVSLMFSKFNG